MRPPFSKGSVEADGKGQASVRKHPKPAEPKEPKEHWWNEPTKIRRDPNVQKCLPPPPFPPSEEERARMDEMSLRDESVRESVRRVQEYEAAMNPPGYIPPKYHWWNEPKVIPDPRIARLREQGMVYVPPPLTPPSEEDYAIYRQECPLPHPARPTYGHGDKGRSRHDNRKLEHAQSTPSRHNSQLDDHYSSQRTSHQERRRR